MSTAPSAEGRTGDLRAEAAAAGGRASCHPVVGGGRDDRALLAEEKPPVIRRAKSGQVLAEHGYEVRRDRHPPDVLDRSILEPAVVVGLPRVDPLLTDRRTSPMERADRQPCSGRPRSVSARPTASSGRSPPKYMAGGDVDHARGLSRNGVGTGRRIPLLGRGVPAVRDQFDPSGIRQGPPSHLLKCASGEALPLELPWIHGGEPAMAERNQFQSVRRCGRHGP